MVAGIGDRRVAAGGATGTNTGGRFGDAGPSGGSIGAGGSQGGSGGGLKAAGGAAGTGGGGADGGVPNAGDAPNAGGSPGNGGQSGASTGGSTPAGGTTGQGGVGHDAATDVPMVGDATTNPSGCSPPGIQGTGNGLQGDYFATSSLTGQVLSRIDATIDYDWGSGAPDMGLPADGFSVRWTGQVQPRFSGRYTFYTTTDDGVRLWIHGSLIIDDWNDHMATESSGTVDLVAGQKYDLKMEYYEAAQLASAQLAWSSPCQAREIIPQSQLYSPPAACPTPAIGTGSGLVGQYFDNQDLTSLQVTRTDPTISFVWPDGTSPDPAIAPGNYSALWTGQVQARYMGFTTFYVASHGGARLFVNDALAFDDWTAHATTEDVATFATTAGQTYNLRLEYYEQSGGGQVQLLWGGSCQAKEIVPTTQLYPSYTGMDCSVPVTGTGIGLRGDYYDNPDFTSLAATHAAETINFDWGMGAPDPAVGADTFSVRWTGKLLARYTGGTTFRTWSDDGVRLWIDGQLIIDDYVDHQAAEDGGLAYLVAGQLYDIKLEFHENLENALIKLLWFSPCQPEEVVPASQLFPPGYVPPDAGIDAGPDTEPDANTETEAGGIDGGVDGP